LVTTRLQPGNLRFISENSLGRLKYLFDSADNPSVLTARSRELPGDSKLLSKRSTPIGAALLFAAYATHLLAGPAKPPKPPAKIAPDVPTSGNVQVIVRYSGDAIAELPKALNLGGQLKA
jgi:hypothetical protein